MEISHYALKPEGNMYISDAHNWVLHTNDPLIEKLKSQGIFEFCYKPVYNFGISRFGSIKIKELHSYLSELLDSDVHEIALDFCVDSHDGYVSDIKFEPVVNKKVMPAKKPIGKEHLPWFAIWMDEIMSSRK